MKRTDLKESFELCKNTIELRITKEHDEKQKSPLWSKILTTLFSTHKIFHGEFQNQKKTTQALSVYRKDTFHVYIKCLIVISWKVTIKRRGSEKRSYFGVPV